MNDLALASWGARFAARLLDGLLIIAGAAVVGVAIGVATTAEIGALVALAAFYLLEPFYFAFFHGSRRAATPGKRALRITLRREDGRPHGFGLALGRAWLTWLFSWIPIMPLIDYLWPLWDAKNQTLHDKCVGTIVVRARAAAPLPARAIDAPHYAPEPLTAEERGGVGA